ncbi:hypothetical protein BDZ97DRAFT_1761865 [Flammula alnicola]|nr:hypothetical protein BDZ97DRAFT_1761865 [Flammula alnicola]
MQGLVIPSFMGLVRRHVQIPSFTGLVSTTKLVPHAHAPLLHPQPHSELPPPSQHHRASADDAMDVDLDLPRFISIPSSIPASSVSWGGGAEGLEATRSPQASAPGAEAAAEAAAMAAGVAWTAIQHPTWTGAGAVTESVVWGEETEMYPFSAVAGQRKLRNEFNRDVPVADSGWDEDEDSDEDGVEEGVRTWVCGESGGEAEAGQAGEGIAIASSSSLSLSRSRSRWR